MPEACYLGPAVSPGELFFRREIQRESRDSGPSFAESSKPSSLLQSIRSIFPRHHSEREASAAVTRTVSELNDFSSAGPSDSRRGTSVAEELAWYKDRVVWSKGSAIFRTFSYAAEKENVQKALFAWFTDEYAGDDPERQERDGEVNNKDETAALPKSSTFGPFSTSQLTAWSDPRRKRSRTSPVTRKPKPRRCLVVFLQTQAHIYFPSGRNEVVTFPFVVQDAWAVKSGGLFLQRVLTRKEQDAARKGKARSTEAGTKVPADMTLDQAMESILDELGDLGPQVGTSDDSRSRMTDETLFFLKHPAQEVTVVGLGPTVQGGIPDRDGKVSTAEASSGVFSLPMAVEVVWVSSEPYPLMAGLDRHNCQLVLYRWAKLAAPCAISSKDNLPVGQHASVPPSAATIKIDVDTGPRRPSVGRKRSSYAPAAERRKSGMGLTTVPHGRSPTRKARRVSLHQDPHIATADATSSTNALRAALDSNSGMIPHAGSSSHVRADVDPPGVAGRVSGYRRASRGPRDVDVADRLLLNHANEMDVRETTMLMGLEESEETLVAEIVLEELYRFAADDVDVGSLTGDQLSIFLTDTVNPYSANVNLFFNRPISALYTLIMTGDHTKGVSLSPLRRRDAVSAVPIFCTREDIPDLAITHTSSDDIEVIAGESGRFTIMTVPGTDIDSREEMAQAMATTLSMSVPDSGATLHHSVVRGADGPPVIANAVGSKVTYIDPSGHALLLDLDMTVKDRLVRQCLLAISNFATQDASNLVRGMTDHCISDRTHASDGFSNFRRVILMVCGVRSNASERKSSSWEQLVAATHMSSARDLRHLHSSGPWIQTDHIDCSPLSDHRVDDVDCLRLMMALHIVAEDCRLDSSRALDVQRLGQLIVDLASDKGLAFYVDYWWRLFPCRQISQSPISAVDIEAPPPVDGHCLLKAILSGTNVQVALRPLARFTTWCVVNSWRRSGKVSFTPNLDSLIRLYCAAANDGSGIASNKSSQVVKVMLEEGIDQVRLRRIPWAIAIPMLEAVRQCKDSPPKGLSVNFYTTIGRLDLACHAFANKRGLNTDTGRVAAPKIAATETAPGDLNIDALVQSSRIGTELPSAMGTGRDSGKQHCLHLPELRFTSDRRLQDVERMLQTSRRRVIRPEDKPHASDHDLDIFYQALANTIALRTLSQFVGRGALTYSTQYASSTEPAHIPPINLGVYLTIPKRTFTLKTSNNTQTDPSGWPSFHNGVAVGLSLREDDRHIDSSWILFNKPEAPTAAHGGFLLGLGLTGHLRSMVTWHAYPYLEPRHDYTSIGILLGLAASYTGSQDQLLTRILSLNVQALLPTGAFDLNSPPSVQAASLLGIGLVYLGSGNHRMADVALSQIGRNLIPGIENSGDYREAYSFSAACAFGLIMLGRGGHRSGALERQFLTRLRDCVLGSSGPPDGSRLLPLNTDIDINITAPGATFALGLMFLKSGRADVSATIRLPQNPYDLDHIRPDLLLIRTLAINMIHWEDVRPTQEWVESCVPSFVSSAWETQRQGGSIDETVRLAYYHIVAGCCFTLGLKYASTINETAHGVLLKYFGVFLNAAAVGSQTYEAKIRRAAVRQGFCVVAIAMAMVVAGSGDLSVYRRLRLAHGGESSFSGRTATHIAAGLVFLGAGRYCLGSSDAAIASMAIAFFPRFANQPDDNRAYLQAYRHLWALAVEPRCFVTTDALTLSKVYLPIKIKYKDENGEQKSKSGISPTLLDSLDRLVSVSTQSPRYTTASLSMLRKADFQHLIRSQTLFVQRKIGYLDYFNDPKGYRTFHSTIAPFSMPGEESRGIMGYDQSFSLSSSDLMRLVKLHTPDATLRWTAATLSREALQKLDVDERNRTFSTGAACETAIVECILADRAYMLPIYLGILQCIDIQDPIRGMLNLTQFKIAKAYYGHQPTDNDKGAVIRRSLIDHVMEESRAKPSSILATPAEARQSVIAYLRDLRQFHSRNPIDRMEVAVATATYLAAHDTPQVDVLIALKRKATEERERISRLPSIPPDARNAIIRLMFKDVVTNTQSLGKLVAFADVIALTSEKSKTETRSEKRAKSVVKMAELDGIWTETAMLDALRVWLQ